MLDNKIVQIALVVLAFYVLLQVINHQTSQEHLDTVVTVPSGAQATVQVQAPTVASAISNSIPQPANSLITPELAATSSNASATPVVTSSPSAALTTKIPAPLTSVEEDIVAAAPKALPQDLAMGKQNANIFAPEPTDLDAMFGQRDQLEPSDLIPKVQDSELYGGFAPDPALNQDFLQTPFSLGIQTHVDSRKFVNDIRGVKFAPPMASFIWNSPVTFPDLSSRTICDIT